MPSFHLRGRSRLRQPPRRVVRLVAPLAGVWLMGTAPAHSADWWTTTDSASRTKTGIDVDRLVCRGGMCTAPQRVADASSADGHTSAVGLAVYDCAGLRMRSDVQVPAPSQWRPVPQGSVAEAILTLVCTYDDRRAGISDDEILYADGREFKRTTKASSPVPKPALPPVPKPALTPKPTPPQNALRRGQTAATRPVEQPAPVVRGLAEGQMAVQIAAAASQALAQSELNGLSHRYPQLLQGLSTHVEAARAGGHQVFRALIVNLPSAQAARQLCAALRSRAVACFVKPGN